MDTLASVEEKRPEISVMAVDDHALLRSGIAAVVNAEPDMRLVAEASSGQEAIEQYRLHTPDVTLMDIRMSDMDGIEAMSQIRAEFPIARVVILTTYEGDAQASRAINAGAMGYLLKGMIRGELVPTIRSVMNGFRKIPQEIAAAIAEHSSDPLSEREIQVLRLVATGLSNRQIAHGLNIAEHTVKVHVRNILAKLGARDRTHAVTIALKRGFLEV